MVTKVKAEETSSDAAIDAGMTDGTETSASNNAGPGQTTGFMQPVATDDPDPASWYTASQTRSTALMYADGYCKHTATPGSGIRYTPEDVIARAKVYLAFLAGAET